MPSLTNELVERGIIDQSKANSLSYEIESSNKKEEKVLLEKDIVPEDTLFSIKSKVLDIPLKKVVASEVPLEILKLIPEDSARYYKMIPLDKDGDTIQIGMVYPKDMKARDALKFLARQGGFSYEIYLITLSEFNELIKRYRSLGGEVKQALEELETEEKERPSKKELQRGEMQRMSEEAPVSKVVSVLLRYAVEGGASDIHIEPTEDRLKVRFRMDGVLHTSLILSLKIHSAVVARIKILSDLQIDETRVPQDGRFSTEVAGRNIDFRVSTFPTTLGEKVAIRVLDPRTRKEDFEDLGLRGRNLNVIKEGSQEPEGLILASGPTGCGKSTTLYAILEMLNEEGVNIVTIEDPVEYSVEGVNQSQVKPDIGYSFAQALRHMLRQDPDIIMVGEIRDKETADLVTHAALTGHVVLSTIHTTGAIGIIPRLMDMGVEPYLLPPTLRMGLAQRLIRTLCDNCKKKVKANTDQEEFIREQVSKMPSETRKRIDLGDDIFIYEPQGCRECNFDGYTGRTGVFEILQMTDALADVISEDASESKLREATKKQEMITMEQDGIIKVLDGVTTLDEVMRVVAER
ncbi:MAG: GspE/PulE family protein [Candidatus Paceibacterota bacterium]